MGPLIGATLSALVAIAAGSAVSQASPSGTSEPLTAVGWLQRASDLTNLRLPGSRPFHMKVTFHAFPGVDFSKKSKPTIIAGDGTYEETWLSPEMWRREVIFTGYHAVEVRANGVRKYEADSDYEPSRVLMMLDALLYPIPRNLISPEFPESHENWKLEHLVAGTIPYVVTTHRERGMNDDWFYYSYSFLPHGTLVRSDFYGLVTSWDKDSTFAGKLVPLHFECQAMGQTLLTADVTVEAAAQTGPELFAVAGPPATPGMTMRPLHMFEIKLAQFYDPISTYLGPGGRGVIRQMIDRKGQARETEVIDSPNLPDLVNFFDSARSKRFYPAKVDGDSCEETFWIRG